MSNSIHRGLIRASERKCIGEADNLNDTPLRIGYLISHSGPVVSERPGKRGQWHQIVHSAWNPRCHAGVIGPSAELHKRWIDIKFWISV